MKFSFIILIILILTLSGCQEDNNSKNIVKTISDHRNNVELENQTIINEQQTLQFESLTSNTPGIPNYVIEINQILQGRKGYYVFDNDSFYSDSKDGIFVIILAGERDEKGFGELQVKSIQKEKSNINIVVEEVQLYSGALPSTSYPDTVAKIKGISISELKDIKFNITDVKGQTFELLSVDMLDYYKISVSPDTKKSIYRFDNYLMLINTQRIGTNQKAIRIVYDNYVKRTEEPYSLWNYDKFKIQWSSDSNYVYIIDSIYDLINDKKIPLDDCLIFSWAGNEGIYLTKGNLYKFFFQDSGFYGIYASNKINVVENGKVITSEELKNDRYFVIFESDWNKSSLFRIKEGKVIVRTANMKYNENLLENKMQEIVELLKKDKEANGVLYGRYTTQAEKNKALEFFGELQIKYPIELQEDGFSNSGAMSWSLDLEFFLDDIKETYIK